MEVARRDAYLTALGIVRYRPRPPPGAAVAPAPPPVDVDPGSTGSQVAPVPSAVAPGGDASPLAALRELPRQPVIAPHPLPEVAAQPVTASEPAASAFRLACWQPAADLLVLDALPAGGVADRERLTLLANILRAIGRLDGSLPAVEYFDWPLLPGGDASEGGAREAVAPFLVGRQAKMHFAWLLAMGESAWRCLSAEAALGEQVAILDDSARAILVPGLGEMLEHPERKADTWRAIRMLAPQRS